MKKYWIGLDIGGTKCAVLLAKVNHGIEIIDKIRFDTCTSKGQAYAYGKLCESIENIMSAHGLTQNDINAIGVSCGGPLDSRKGIVLCPPHLPGWVNIPLKKQLEERFGIETFIQNDANACALVEWKLGAGRGTTNMIFLTMGTGMGGGIIAEGKLLSGNTDMGGEIGHLRLTEDGPVGFGKAGSVEGYTSGDAIMALAKDLTNKLIAEGKEPAWTRDGIKTENITTKLIADYAHAGDEDAIQLFKFVGKMLGRLLGTLTDSFNPECIVIGSIFVRCEDLLRESMEAELTKEAIPFSLNGMRVVPAGTGEAIGDLASIMTALYALGIDPLETGDEQEDKVIKHFDRLFERYPALEGCREDIMQAYIILRDCFKNDGKLLVCGNGGSCSDSEHIVGELMKGFWLKRPLNAELIARLSAEMDDLLPGAAEKLQQGLPAIAITGHNALTTAVQNDCDATLGMAQQVIGYGRKNDVLIGITTSGNSKNVLLAVAAAKAKGMKTIGLTGGNGGKLAKMSDCSIIVPANTPAEVQEFHLPVYHCLCAMVESKFFDK